MRLVLLVIASLLLCCPEAAAQQGGTRAASRAKLLKELRKCLNPARTPGCSEDSVFPVARLYEQGDTSVLPKLMDVAPNSDGALSEALGGFFSGLLCRRPETFLRAVTTRRSREHDNLLLLAATGDGSGMGCRDTAGLRRRLNGLSRSRNRQLAALAVKSLEQVNKYNPER